MTRCQFFVIPFIDIIPIQTSSWLKLCSNWHMRAISIEAVKLCKDPSSSDTIERRDKQMRGENRKNIFLAWK